MRFISTLQHIQNIIINKLYKSKGYVFTFHIVSNSYSSNQKDIAITEESFISFIEYFYNRNFVFKKINELDINSKPSNIYITFDDVHKSVYLNAYPLLKKMNIPFTCFVTTSYMDTKDFLNTDMLIDLVNDPLVTIGSHSVTHPLMRKCTKEKILYELGESQKIISNKINKETKYFAFPFGSLYAVSSRVRKLCKASNYIYSFSNVGRKLTRRDFLKNNFISRININEDNYKKYMVEYE